MDSIIDYRRDVVGRLTYFLQVFLLLATISVPFDLSATFPNGTFPAGTLIYYRVGVRASGDALTPLPGQTPDGGDYVYSAPASFVKN